MNDELVTLVHKSKGSNTVVIAGNFIAPDGNLSAPEARLDGHCALSAERIEKEDRHLQFSIDSRLFLSSANFLNSSLRAVTRRCNSTSNMSEIDHIVVTYR